MSNFKEQICTGADFQLLEAVGYISVLNNVNLEGFNLSNAKLNGSKLNAANFTELI